MDERGISIADHLRWCGAKVDPGVQVRPIPSSVIDTTIKAIAVTDLVFCDLVNVAKIQLNLNKNTLWEYDVRTDDHSILCPLFQGLDALILWEHSEIRVRLTGDLPPQCSVTYREVVFESFDAVIEAKYRLGGYLHIRRRFGKHTFDIHHGYLIRKVWPMSLQAQRGDLLLQSSLLVDKLGILGYEQSREGALQILDSILESRTEYRQQVQDVLRRVGVPETHIASTICTYAEI